MQQLNFVVVIIIIIIDYYYFEEPPRPPCKVEKALSPAPPLNLRAPQLAG